MAFDRTCRRAILVMLCFMHLCHALTLESSQGMLKTVVQGLGRGAVAAGRAGQQFAIRNPHGAAQIGVGVTLSAGVVAISPETRQVFGDVLDSTCPTCSKAPGILGGLMSSALDSVKTGGTAWKDEMARKIREQDITIVVNEDMPPMIDANGDDILDGINSFKMKDKNFELEAKMMPWMIAGMGLTPAGWGMKACAKGMTAMMLSATAADKQLNLKPSEEGGEITMQDRGELLAQSFWDFAGLHGNACVSSTANAASALSTVYGVYYDLPEGTEGSLGLMGADGKPTEKGYDKLRGAFFKATFAGAGAFRGIRKNLAGGGPWHGLDKKPLVPEGVPIIGGKGASLPGSSLNTLGVNAGIEAEKDIMGMFSNDQLYGAMKKTVTEADKAGLFKNAYRGMANTKPEDIDAFVNDYSFQID